VQDNLEDCTLCYACVEVCKKYLKKGEEETGITVTGEENKFIFKFETDGSIKAKEAFEYAVKFLEEKFNDFRDQVSKLK